MARTPNNVVLFFPELLENQNPLLVPLELLSLAPPLLSAGFDVRILDERLEPLTTLNLKAELARAICVGISIRPGGQVFRGFRFARAVKAVRPDLPVVMGGWFPSIVPERVLAHPAVDYVVTGEGETAFLELVNALSSGRSVDGIPGIARLHNGRFEHAPPIPSSHIASSPCPAYHLLDIERYIGRERELSYISSKGCTGTCKFCAIHCGYADQWHPRPSGTVIRDITQLVRTYHLRRIRFVDANFFADEERVRAIMDGFIREGLGIEWQAPGRADQLNALSDDTWDLLQRGGCRRIEVGAESATQRILDDMDKGITPDDIRTFAETTHRYGIAGIFNYILGIPGETLEDLRRTIDAIHALRHDYPDSTFAIYRFSPIPITELYAPLQGAPPGETDPESIEQYKIYRLTPDQPWLERHQARIVDMIFYFYLPFSLRISRASPSPVALLKHLLIRCARVRIRRFDFRFPFEWWLLRIGTRVGLCNPQRFRQWAQS